MMQGDSHELVERFRAGQSRAADAIFDRYVNRLLALTRNRLSGSMRRRVDPEDVVQSSFRSFFLHARNGEYAVQEAGDLWRLLVQITLHKLYGQVEWHRAQRRSVVREERLDDFSIEEPGVEPTPVEVVALVEQMHLISGRLTHDQQLALTLQLQGMEHGTIAEAIQKSPRTVRRLLAEVRERMERELAGDSSLDRDERSKTIAREVDRRVVLKAEDFVLERMIGAGGMGKVYLATDCRTGQKVAVKTLRKMHQHNNRAVEQFIQEAEILSTLRHPNIVGVHGLGRFPGGGLFIVMEHVEGTNLQERLRRGPLGVRQSLAIFVCVAEAVDHAHQRGFVHADLKPGNVLMDNAGRPVVTDFGFARILAAENSSRSLRAGGTAGYMAPEVQHLSQSPTIAADIYGLGALLWAICSGGPPEWNENFETILDKRILIGPICRRCLAPLPADRFRNVSDLLAQLTALRGQPGNAP